MHPLVSLYCSVFIYIFEYLVFILILSKESERLIASRELDSHVVYLDVAVVWGRDQELGVWGEGEGSDGHGVTWGEREDAVTESSDVAHLHFPGVYLEA